MTNLSQEQEEMRQSIQKSAMIWSIIFALVVAGVAYWALGGQSVMVRMGVTAAAGIIILVGIFKWRFSANSKSAQCAKCATAFSISKTNHVETLKSSTAKESRDAQEDHSTKVTTWTEEIYGVVDTYTCASCDDTQTKEYTTTRKKDEKSVVEPAPVKEKPEAPKTRSAPKADATAKAAPKAKTAAKAKPAAKAKTAAKAKPAAKPKTRKAPKSGSSGSAD